MQQYEFEPENGIENLKFFLSVFCGGSSRDPIDTTVQLFDGCRRGERRLRARAVLGQSAAGGNSER